MGNSEDSANRLPLPSAYSILNYGYCKVWKHATSHEEVYQQYEISIEQEKLPMYTTLFPIHNTHPYLPALHYFSLVPQQYLCSSTLQATLLLQRIPYRLSQFRNVPIQDTALLYHSALSGYYGLYSAFGLFRVRSTMIGINNQGKVKVWCHTDYGNAEPEDGGVYKVEDMLSSLIKAVEFVGDWEDQEVTHVEQRKNKMKIPRLSYFVQCNPQLSLSTFHSAITALSAYSARFCLVIPESLTEITAYLKKVEGWQQMSYNQNFLANINGKNLMSTQGRSPSTLCRNPSSSGRNLSSSQGSSRQKFSFKDSLEHISSKKNSIYLDTNKVNSKYSMNTQMNAHQQQMISRSLEKQKGYAHSHVYTQPNQSMLNQRHQMTQPQPPRSPQMLQFRSPEQVPHQQQQIYQSPVPLTIQKIHFVTNRAPQQLNTSFGLKVPEASSSKKSIYNSKSNSFSIQNRGRQGDQRQIHQKQINERQIYQRSPDQRPPNIQLRPPSQKLESSTSFMEDSEIREKLNVVFSNAKESSFYYYGKKKEK